MDMHLHQKESLDCLDLAQHRLETAECIVSICILPLGPALSWRSAGRFAEKLKVCCHMDRASEV